MNTLIKTAFCFFILNFSASLVYAAGPASIGIKEISVSILQADILSPLKERVLIIIADGTGSGDCSGDDEIVQASRFDFKTFGMTDADADKALDNLISMALSAKLSGTPLKVFVNNSCKVSLSFGL